MGAGGPAEQAAHCCTTGTEELSPHPFPLRQEFTFDMIPENVIGVGNNILVRDKKYEGFRRTARPWVVRMRVGERRGFEGFEAQ